MPMVPPVARKNVADEVATPMSRAATEFCTAIIIVCMFRPRPTPSMNRMSARFQYAVSTVTVSSSNDAPAIRAVPITGKIL